MNFILLEIDSRCPLGSVFSKISQPLTFFFPYGSERSFFKPYGPPYRGVSEAPLYEINRDLISSDLFSVAVTTCTVMER